jgi:E3 ubiquitin-protein ligase HUWE1
MAKEETLTNQLDRERNQLECEQLRCLGLLAAKALFEGRVVAAVSRWSPVIFKHLLKEPVDIEDLRAFMSPDEFRHRTSYIRNCSDAELVEHGVYLPVRDNQEVLVRAHNRDEVLSLYVQHRLIESRRPALDAFCRGFQEFCSPMLHELRDRRCSGELLRLLIGGEPALTAAAIVASLRFSGFPARSPTPDHMRALLGRKTQQELEDFLFFVTSTRRLPYGEPFEIRVRHHPLLSAQHLPLSHTCYNELDLPDYRDEAVLDAKLSLAMRGAGSTMAVA